MPAGPPTTDPASRAVFLSYASQDAEAAKKICDALRAAGVEVWFDQSELRGGDSWDRKIRKQIKECALFVPVISANTQARAEGYFRLEWLLAVERSRLMAEEKPFLVPVVIDATADANASVPEKFRDVQWTRLRQGYGGQARPEGEDHALAAFCTRVKNLLEGSAAPGRAVSRDENAAPAMRAKPRRSVPVVGSGVVLLAMVGAGIFFALKKNEPLATPSAANTAQPPGAAEKSAPAQTEAQKLIARIWEISDREQDASGEEWALAEDFGAQAVKLEPNNATAWAAYSRATWGNGNFNDSLLKQRDEAQQRAWRAMTLAPESFEARLAWANIQRLEASTVGSAEKSLRQLLTEQPNNRRVLRLLAYTLRDQARDGSLIKEACALLDRAAALPGSDASALVGKGAMLTGRTIRGFPSQYSTAEAAYDAALKIRNGPNSLATKMLLRFELDGKLDEALALLQRAPDSFWQKEGKASFVAWLWLCRRDAKRALDALGPIRSDYLIGWSGMREFIGPRGALTGKAHQLAGNSDAAQLDWRAALQVVERRLTAAPNEPLLFFWKAWLLASLGDEAGSRAALKIYEQYAGVHAPVIERGAHQRPATAEIYLKLGERIAVLDALEERAQTLRQENAFEEAAILHNRLTYDPAWDALRGDERFETLLKRLADFAASRAPAKP